jgi:hypothetical protein
MYDKKKENLVLSNHDDADVFFLSN